jgi:hypothetical protein
MGKVLVFEILFQKQTPLYMGGEILNGVVNIRLNERLKINSVNFNQILFKQFFYQFYYLSFNRLI